VVGESNVYRGIPYAAPPVGSLRWVAPQPVAPWTAVLPTTDYGPPCMQTDFAGGTRGSEDCLTLNVWVPRNAGSPLPVMVFIHGGSNVSGSSSDYGDGVYYYDGQYLAEHGPVVVVTINYRVGSLGFLVHPALSAESPQHVSGNYGILDQIAALRWVKANIGVMGGDPSRVLLFGQSAGSMNTCVLLTSPLSEGLFSRAMMLSGACSAVGTRVEARQAGIGVAAALGCAGVADVAACLRSRSAAEVTAAPVSFDGSGVDAGYNGSDIDGYVVPANPLARLKAGAHHHVPIIVSTTSDEYTTLQTSAGYPIVSTESAYRAAIAKFYGASNVAAIVNLYPSDHYATINDAFVDLISDDSYTCPARSDLRAAAAGQSEPVRRAFFTHTFEMGRYRKYRAAHVYDTNFGFHNFGTIPVSAAELSFSDAMVGYWTAFAATGDPNGASRAAWPSYDATLDDALRLDESLSVIDHVHEAQCDYWDSFWGR
jgi:para-nitrobenzyl esterase